MTIIDFELSHKKGNEKNSSSSNSEHLILNFNELESISDERLALARLTATAQRLINDGINAETVHKALYRAGAHMACRDLDELINFVEFVHDQATKNCTYLCKDRLAEKS